MTAETCLRLAEHFEKLGDKEKAAEYKARAELPNRTGKPPVKKK